jgi:Delta3,5-Delta2,4-dienoyl-CoA isomerase
MLVKIHTHTHAHARTHAHTPVGGGIDLLCCCDIRLAQEEAWFTIKEVDVGLAADLGTLQRLPKIVGNDSIVRELAYTARRFGAQEAKEIGFLSSVLPDRDALYEAAHAMASVIAAKSPVAVVGTKVNLNYARDHGVAEALAYQAAWNGATLQTEDLPKSFMASLKKETPKYSKL